jgi:hypothetical protein
MTNARNNFAPGGAYGVTGDLTRAADIVDAMAGVRRIFFNMNVVQARYAAAAKEPCISKTRRANGDGPADGRRAAVVYDAAGGVGRYQSLFSRALVRKGLFGSRGRRSGARIPQTNPQPNHQAPRRVTGRRGTRAAERRDTG